VVLTLDEMIITETPPLCFCSGRIGQQICVPITGNRSKRIIHGVINIITGELLLLITTDWDALTHQYFLEMIRSHWRGWRIILFEDRGSPHTAEDSVELAQRLGIRLRLLPRACPELNPMDHLFRFVRGQALADRATLTIDQSADAACRDLYEISGKERLIKAGVFSDHFWLTT